MFLQRQLHQAIWLLLLDKDFLKAYLQGMIVNCGDGITRQVYIRVLLTALNFVKKYVVLSLRISI